MKIHQKIDGNIFVLRAVETGDQIFLLFRQGDNTATVSYDMGSIEVEGCKAVKNDQRITITGDLTEFTIQAVISCDLSHITGPSFDWQDYPSEASIITAGADFMDRAKVILGLAEPEPEEATD